MTKKCNVCDKTCFTGSGICADENRHKPYNVWEMDKHGQSRRIDQCGTLADANTAVDRVGETGFAYVIKWTTTHNPITGTIERTSRYICGVLDGWKHTIDMRATVRKIIHVR